MDTANWNFPTDRLKGRRLCLCTRPSGILKRRKIFGARLECQPISLPDINWSFERERMEDEVHLMLGIRFPHAALSRLAGKDFSREDLAVDESEESVYLFGQHLELDTLHITFGELEGSRLPAKVKVRIDLSYVEKPAIECVLSMRAELEHR